MISSSHLNLSVPSLMAYMPPWYLYHLPKPQPRRCVLHVAPAAVLFRVPSLIGLHASTLHRIRPSLLSLDPMRRVVLLGKQVPDMRTVTSTVPLWRPRIEHVRLGRRWLTRWLCDGERWCGTLR